MRMRIGNHKKLPVVAQLHTHVHTHTHTLTHTRAHTRITYALAHTHAFTDASLMPRNRKTWASWNFLGSSKDSETAAVCVSYYVNRLQVCVCVCGRLCM